MNPGTGGRGGRSQPPLWVQQQLHPVPGDLYREFGGRMQFPSSSGKSMSAHGENCLDQQGGKKTAETGYGGLIFHVLFSN